ncbi:MAG: glycoside hydrolase family 78 protein [Tannerella sp.]|jgi:alpha-L-rhamnosidase|nr:glycoside hydrolase family 78 protein [Tannerella sp.]
MIKKGLFYAFILSVLCATNSCRQPQSEMFIHLTRLRCEQRDNPLGIDCRQPHLSWEIVCDENAATDSKVNGVRDVRQKAYRLLVASTRKKLDANDGDLWDSGEVKSDSSVLVAYKGKPLVSRHLCFWKVKVTTNKGKSDWSEPHHWSMGLLEASDWQGEWTGLERTFDGDVPQGKKTRISARYFRKEFETRDKQLVRATVYVSGLGVYNLFVNGVRAGDIRFAPAVSEYTKTVYYNTYDVTADVRQGNNAIAIALGNGIYYTIRDWVHHFGFPKFILQLELDYADGERQTLVSDNTWRVTAAGPILANNWYDGEEYDARRELTGWQQVGYDDSKWLQSEKAAHPGGTLRAQADPGIKVMQEMRPKSIVGVKPDVYVLDLGQNISGHLRMKVKGKSGDIVTIRYAERQNPDGTIYTENLRTADSKNIYILKGGGEEVYEPTFVYHGFRYAEITGFPTKPTIDDFTAFVTCDEMEATGEFECSDATINSIFRNAWWCIRDNYQSVPVDCPQRDERWGWLGDRSVGCYGESFIFDNALLYAKWMNDIEDSQTSEGALFDIAPNHYTGHKPNDNITWPSTYLFVANMLYGQFGNIEPLRRHYPSMKRWLTYMRDNYMQDSIMPRDNYGDWCFPPSTPAASRKTEGILLGSAYYYRMLTLMQRFAGLLEKPDDAVAYATEAANVRKAFNRKFLNIEKAQYSNNTATANLLALAFDLAPDELRQRVFENLVSIIMDENGGHVSTGLIGCQWTMRELTDGGRPDVAWRLATNRDYPSWGYMVENGATTIWELWNGNTAGPSMNSHNHVMILGDLLVWLYEYLGAIRAVEPGFKHVEMKPLLLPKLEYVTATHRSPYGMYRSAWKKLPESCFQWEITVPANSSATVYVPARDKSAVVESGGKLFAKTKDVRFVGMNNGFAVFEVGSGNYKIKSII